MTQRPDRPSRPPLVRRDSPAKGVEVQTIPPPPPLVRRDSPTKGVEVQTIPPPPPLVRRDSPTKGVEVQTIPPPPPLVRRDSPARGVEVQKVQTMLPPPPLVRRDSSTRDVKVQTMPPPPFLRRDSPARGMEAQAPERPRVLVVDDSLNVRLAVRAILTDAGFAVTACDTAAGAQMALRLNEYALAILDVVLPDGSGLDLLAEIRAAASEARVPVIMASAHADASHRVRGLRAGADEFLTKPFDEKRLVQRARALVYGRAHSPNLTPSPAPAVRPTSAPPPAPSSLPPNPAPSPGTIPPPAYVPVFAPPELPPSEPPPEVVSRKLLVVEDSVAYRKRLAAVLEPEGFEVTWASTSEEALDLLRIQRFDGALINAQIPTAGGIPLCRAMRADWRHKAALVLLLASSTALPRMRVAGLQAGADQVIVRALEIGWLGKAMSEHFNGA